MDHALRTISYIADIGELLVIMARRRPTPTDDVQVIGSTPKMICHVFESEEVRLGFKSSGGSWFEFCHWVKIRPRNFDNGLMWLHHLEGGSTGPG